jgi:hypothetical protein
MKLGVFPRPVKSTLGGAIGNAGVPPGETPAIPDQTNIAPFRLRNVSSIALSPSWISDD